MPPVKYTATIVPNIVRKGDKVRLKGILTDDATEFSVNFVNEHCKNPAFITYHFKWIVNENVIVQNYKDNGNWINHKEEIFDSLDGPTFELEFAFQETHVYVYRIYQNTPNYITSYETYFDISDIKAVQVWGDVMKITEISFRYDG